MQNITIIGLGAMGGAITRTLLCQGYAVTVWNRSMEKAEPFIKEGAQITTNVADAIRASHVSIICVSDYQTSYEILDNEKIQAALPNRILIQLSTGSPQQARDLETWANRYEAGYIDGAIAATPSQMGGPEATIFTSGSPVVFEECKEVLQALAGNVPYCGEQVSAASSMDLAFLSYLFGSYIGFFHAARILETDGLRVDDFGSMIAHISPMIGSLLRYEGEVIQTSAYENPQSSLQMSMVSVELLKKQAQEHQMNSEFPVFLHGIFEKAIQAGYGNEDVASLVKILR